MMKRSFFLLLLLFGALYVPAAATVIDSRFELPYSFGNRLNDATAGSKIQARLSLETAFSSNTVYPIRLQLPAGVSAPSSVTWDCAVQPNGSRTLNRRIEMPGGYGLWFELLTFELAPDLPAGPLQFLVETDTVRTYNLFISETRHPAQAATLETIVLPLDKDGQRDERQAENSIALRDRTADGYKNMLQGKGASNQELEALHPLCYLGVDIHNPAGHQTTAQLTIRLLDKNSGSRLPGLLTPGSTGEDREAAELNDSPDELRAMVSLNGNSQQRFLLPVYADERKIAGGSYLLEATLDDGCGQPQRICHPVQLIRQKSGALVTAALLGLVFFVAIAISLHHLPVMLREWKSRWLVTTSLFSATIFCAVNVPTTLLGELFHLLLGPFSFILSGLFSGSIFYLLLLALAVQVPRAGVIALLFLVRLILGMLAFGHISPLLFISYAFQALLLESAFQVARAYPESGGSFCSRGRQQEFFLALLCAAADCIATYGNLQLAGWLHRLYYADWYIALVLTVNGFFYTLCGVLGGLRLGRYLAQIGGD